jgi:serine/threonine protein kinase/Tol biopolymer transport system component/tetratricopeptide (TPR) repeat protein
VTAERWKEIKEIFACALERQAAERAEYLDAACAGDASLRREVESLLASHQQAGEFIETPALSTDTTLGASGEEDDADIGRRIGAYRTVKEIGRGGMGSVYLAVRADDEFERRVAIKLIRRGMEIDFIVRRFRNERQILANLDHPYIARLLDGGTTEEGLPYFVMEYVDGLPIQRYCEDSKLPVPERLKLFEKVCEAVQYAHGRQVIHRDLKPGNVLVTTEGTPKLLDFGVAKLLDPDLKEHTAEPTTAGFRMMTPAYASPEQLHGEPATAASDVYSLGVLLCELITGRRPERSGTPTGPPDERLAGGLDNIIAKATSEKPGQRYAIAAQLAEDLRRYAEGHALSAGPYAALPAAAAVGTDRSTGPKSIAVVPFQTLGAEDKSDEYLGIGMADALITKLSNIRRIIIRPTSSVLRYVHGANDLLAVARELDVDYVLDGRVRRSGDRVRITVQLVRGSDGAPLWAAKFDEKFTDILNLEDSLSEQVAQALIVRLTEEERGLLHKRGTANAQAYQAYLKGRYYWNSVAEDALSKALVAFMEALALDPQFAHAQAGVADYYNWLGVWNVLPPAECFASAKDAARKALELDPTLAEAHAALGFAQWAYDRDWEGAERSMARAIELDPDYPTAHQWYAYLASARGRHEEALGRIERAQKLNPFASLLVASSGFVCYNARLFDRCLQELQRAVRMEPKDYISQQGFAWAYGQLGRHTEAVAAAEKALAIAPDNALVQWALGSALAAAGREAEAREILRQMTEASETRTISFYYMAVIHAVLGEREAALARLEQAFERCDWWTVWMANEPRLDALRSDPRFQQLMTRVGPRESTTLPPVTTSTSSAPAGERRPRRAGVYALVALGVLIVLIVLTVAGKLFLWRNGPRFQNLKIVKLRTNGNAFSAAISPDGRYVAYTLDEGGKQAIWIRQTAVAAGVRIVPPAQMNFRGLTFSRDGAHLYYLAYERNDFAHGAVFQVPVLGGPLRKVITDVESPITLSPDGKRAAFVRDNGAAGENNLIVANLDGNDERTLATRRHPDQFAFASAPAWSPDGSVIAAAIESSDAHGRSDSLITIRLKDGEQKPLVSQRWQFVERMAWLPDGSALLLIGQDPESTFQQVWTVPAGGGKPRKVTNDLNDYIGISLTADSRQLATIQFQILSSIWVAPKDNFNNVQEISSGAGRFYDLAWTPDGKILSSSDASDTVDLWSREADGSAPRQLTANARRNYAPAVSPDGRHIALHSNRTGAWNIWMVDADGGNPQPLTADNKTDSNWPQISPDGQWVIFHRPSAGGRFRLWKAPIAGGQETQITGETCMRPAISPRDGMIACWYSEPSSQPQWRIGIYPPEGGRPVKTFEFPPSVSIDSALHWTPDGRAVAYVDNRGGAANIWSQPLDGTPARPLTNFHAAQIFSFAWSRDGRLAYSRGLQAFDVVLISDVR